MSDSSEKPWSDNLNAPQIPSFLYLTEKEAFAGTFIGAILYGVVTVLFFECVAALLNPASRIKGGFKWGLMAHTVAMFSFLTIPLAIDLSAVSGEYVNRRNFPGDETSPPGPFGYSFFSIFETQFNVYRSMFPLNQWLADGLLLYRCYMVYFMNYWVMAFPCLIYLGSVAMGIAAVYQRSHPGEDETTVINVGTSYFSISLSLSILLTLMIVTRLTLHRRNFRNVTGASQRVGGLYTAIVTTLIESYALYAIAFLLYIVPWAVEHPIVYIFSQALGHVQVIAPYLVILRVANRKALTNDMIVSRPAELSSLDFKSQGESTDCEKTLPDGDAVNSLGANDEAPGRPGVEVENVVEEVPL